MDVKSAVCKSWHSFDLITCPLVLLSLSCVSQLVINVEISKKDSQPGCIIVTEQFDNVSCKPTRSLSIFLAFG